MSRTIDLDRPTSLTDQDRHELAQLPELIQLKERRECAKKEITPHHAKIADAKGTRLYTKYQRACRDYRNALGRAETAKLKEVRQRYNQEQPRRDIEKQLMGPGKASTLGDVSQVPVKFSLKERYQAVDALLVFADLSSPPPSANLPGPQSLSPTPDEGKHSNESDRRRVDAIEALVALGRLHEARTPASCKAARARRSSPGGSPSHEDPELPEEWKLECKPLQCIFCLGDKTLAPSRRLHEFSEKGGLKKHLINCHLTRLPNDGPIDCPHPACNEVLRDKLTVRNHAENVHVTPT